METAERIILGIDPGSHLTGFGIIKVSGPRQSLIAAGCIRSKHKALERRLQHIHQQLCEAITQYNPQEAAIEQVFTHLNPQSALKLGQARGAALVAVATFLLPLSEYSARTIKKAVVGHGAANKSQVQHMVKSLLKLKETPQADAADALAIAICHANYRYFHSRITEGQNS